MYFSGVRGNKWFADSWRRHFHRPFWICGCQQCFLQDGKRGFLWYFCIFNPTPNCRQTWQETSSQFGELVSDLRWWCWWLTRASHTEQRECFSINRSHLIDSSLKDANSKADCFHCPTKNKHLKVNSGATPLSRPCPWNWRRVGRRAGC